MYVPNPEKKSFLEDNVVVTMNNPLVLVKDGCNAQVVNPPSNIEKSQHVGFDFVTNILDLSSVVPVDGVCSGKFCHAQKERESWACIKADSKRHWFLKFRFNCDEFEEMSNGHVNLTSNATTSIMVASSIINVPLCNQK